MTHILVKVWIRSDPVAATVLRGASNAPEHGVAEHERGLMDAARRRDGAAPPRCFCPAHRVGQAPPGANYERVRPAAQRRRRAAREHGVEVSVLISARREGDRRAVERDRNRIVSWRAGDREDELEARPLSLRGEREAVLRRSEVVPRPLGDVQRGTLGVDARCVALRNVAEPR